MCRLEYTFLPPQGMTYRRPRIRHVSHSIRQVIADSHSAASNEEHTVWVLDPVEAIRNQECFHYRFRQPGRYN